MTAQVNLLSEDGFRRLLGPEGSDVAMSEDEAERYAGPPPGPAELEELSALAGEVTGLPVMVLCPEGYQVPVGSSCSACPGLASCSPGVRP